MLTSCTHQLHRLGLSSLHVNGWAGPSQLCHFASNLLMEFSDPYWSGIVARRGRLLAKVAWSDDQLDIVEAGVRDENEEFFDSRVSDREKSDGFGASMNHNIAAKESKVASVGTSTLDISSIRVVYA